MKALIAQGLKPVHLQFLTVEQLVQIYKFYDIEYGESEKTPKSSFVDKLDTALRLRNLYVGKDDDSSEKQQKLQNERLLLEIEKSKQETLNLQVRKEMLELELRIKQEGGNTPVPKATINTNVLPHFDEDDPDNFFSQFEKIAYHWERELWPILVQTHFKGKARDAFANLGAEESKDYEKVKQAVLLAYELSAEAYRQRFRQSRMDNKGTYVEFAASKTKAFTKWMTAAKIDTIEELREAMLIEEFLRQIPLEMRHYLSDKEVKSLSQLAQMADTYALSRKLGKGTRGQQHKEKGTSGAPKETNVSPKPNRHCPKCGKYGEPHEKCPDFIQKVRCVKCNEKGHYAIVCDTRKSIADPKDDQSFEDDHRPMAFLHTNVKEETLFAPHLYRSYLAPARRKRGRVVTVLRDTGAAQSLVLRSVLKKNMHWKFTGDDVICRGLDNQRISAPLVKVFLKCEKFTGICQLGVVDSLPIKSAQLLLGNDVVHNVPSGAPVMCSQIISPIESDDIPSSDMLPASAVTRFQTRGKMSVVRPDDRLVDPPSKGALVHLDKVKLLEEQVNELLAFLSKIKEGIKNCSDGYSNYRNLTLSSSTSKVLRR